ncbi:hypothetical protein Gotri_016800 [Gossypium trilobum]|uniref:Uncharacterized protein n=1 Tax=Gossypium trilobum TaxID=34281 RepID=A0A7J9E5B5_9ROSI|nr:hypothetical protein [Gossypium trilobum]
MVGVFRLVSGCPGPSGFGSASTAQEVTEGIDGTNLTALVTGHRLSLLHFFAIFTSSPLHLPCFYFFVILLPYLSSCRLAVLECDE